METKKPLRKEEIRHKRLINNMELTKALIRLREVLQSKLKATLFLNLTPEPRSIHQCPLNILFHLRTIPK